MRPGGMPNGECSGQSHIETDESHGETPNKRLSSVQVLARHQTMNTAYKETWGSSPEVLTFYPTGQITYSPGHNRAIDANGSSVPIMDESLEMGIYTQLPDAAKQEFLLSTLGSSDATNSDKALQARQGLRGLTPHARRQTKFGTMWLEREHGIKHLTFATCTLPPELTLTKAEVERCLPNSYRNEERSLDELENSGKVTARKWSLIINRFNKKLMYELEKHGLPPEYIGVTELQEKRWIERGEVGYHYHVCFKGRKEYGTWMISPSRMEQMWKDACLSVTGGGTSISFRSSTNLQRVKKSVTAYLGKYLTKGTALKLLVEEGLYLVVCPFAWYSCSATLKRLYKTLIVRYSGREASLMFRSLMSVASEQLSFWKWITVLSPDGTLMHVAWTGELKDLDWGKPYVAR